MFCFFFPEKRLKTCFCSCVSHFFILLFFAFFHNPFRVFAKLFTQKKGSNFKHFRLAFFFSPFSLSFFFEIHFRFFLHFVMYFVFCPFFSFFFFHFSLLHFSFSFFPLVSCFSFSLSFVLDIFAFFTFVLFFSSFCHFTLMFFFHFITYFLHLFELSCFRFFFIFSFFTFSNVFSFLSFVSTEMHNSSSKAASELPGMLGGAERPSFRSLPPGGSRGRREEDGSAPSSHTVPRGLFLSANDSASGDAPVPSSPLSKKKKQSLPPARICVPQQTKLESATRLSLLPCSGSARPFFFSLDPVQLISLQF